LSFDLMCGIPQLRLAELKQSLQMILELRPSHLSLYELTCEPGTRYARWVAAYPRQRPTLEAVVAQQRMAARMLADYGFYRYEVSSYARPGAECLHNLRYWRGGDYVGLGLGAATRIEHVVVSNPREFNEYEQVVDRAGGSDDLRRGRSMLKRPAGNGVPAIAPAADRFLRLRTRAGVTADEISIKSEWLVRDWVRHSDRRLEVSAKGLSFADLMARQAD
jgi:coproporphyrinogen III oxidase-like Fe-S oxidoreductase